MHDVCAGVYLSGRGLLLFKGGRGWCWTSSAIRSQAIMDQQGTGATSHYAEDERWYTQVNVGAMRHVGSHGDTEIPVIWASLGRQERIS